MGAFLMREAAKPARAPRAISNSERVCRNIMVLTMTAIGLASVLACADGRDGGLPGSPSPSQPPDVSTWLAYRNQTYGVSVQYPAAYKVHVLNNQLEQGQLFRVGFQRATLTGPALDLEPPAFAIDVYNNASQAPLAAWLAANAHFIRPTQEPVQIGGVPGIRVMEQVLVAPGMFYYVARGSYVYRFTPLAAEAQEMLKTVEFTQ